MSCKKPIDEDFNRGTQLFWCPWCLLCPAWLTEGARDVHVVRVHPGKFIPEGSGLPEWRLAQFKELGNEEIAG